MLQVSCYGSPYEIGYHHGLSARALVHSSIAFYTGFFLETTQLHWASVCDTADKWLPYLSLYWPDLVEEMRGLATGASVPLASVLALNNRTEVAYGLSAPAPTLSDGCTALSYHRDSSTGHGSAILAQNWDWHAAQAPNLIFLSIKQASPKANISMVTEAGIIGKIGLNGLGIGVCLNAIAAKGVSYEKLPVHLALRAVLDGVVRENRPGNAEELARMLRQVGVASAAHILVADTSGAAGLETSCEDVVPVRGQRMGGAKVVVHTNHYVEAHKGAVDVEGTLKDSRPRLERIEALLRKYGGQIGVEEVAGCLRDEEGFPVSICRERTGSADSRTLFSIIMDLKAKTAQVKMGRPTEDGEVIILRP